jgi:DNA helicase INO80
MDQNGYNSSVLQRPPRRGDDGGEEDRDSRPHHHHRHHHHHHHHRRDGDLPAGPVAGEAATASSNAGGANAHQHSTFSLRSPKSEYRPPPFSSPNGHNHSHQNTSTPSANHSLQSPPRPALSNPYMSSSTSAPGGPVAPPLPPPVGINSSSSPGSSAVGLHQHHHQSGAPAHPHRAAPPPVSPLHPPVAYYPPGTNTDIYIPPPEPKPASRGFYDPTTDTTKERRISDAATPGASWHNANANAPPAGTPKVRGANPLLFCL